MNKTRENFKISTTPLWNGSIKEAWDMVWPSVNKIGFDYGVYSFLNPTRKHHNIMITKNVMLWLRYHIENQYIRYDPVARVGFDKKIVIWNHHERTNKMVEKITNERKDYGMKSGITVPVCNKAGILTSWVSLSTSSSQEYLDSIISEPSFTSKVYEIHIKTASYALSFKTGLPFNICYAIVLSQYTHQINFIAEKTGFSVDELQKLFGQLYLYCRNVDFFCLDVEEHAIDQIRDLQYFLEKKGICRYTFSKRQLECIDLIKKGLTAKQAARVLNISHRTYEEYTRHIREKLNCVNQRELLGKLLDI